MREWMLKNKDSAFHIYESSLNLATMSCSTVKFRQQNQLFRDSYLYCQTSIQNKRSQYAYVKLQKCQLHQMMCTEGQQIYIQLRLLLTLKQKICYLLKETVSSSKSSCIAKSSWIESNKVCLLILFIRFFSDYGALTMIWPVVGVKVMSCYPSCLVTAYYITSHLRSSKELNS